ncbi:hypothetical protein BGZ80_010431 [Entomortierella chlamydospora]|uniref:AB hydrolase-1 domain-containing protein n=1 Tax=Entomortierella chlamydospora TaxID=101097 RepID=A0A9P6MVC5_9FUNG|nr:hypothetical protein BGZ80_010431 [Entomortierella chlamydospora]
MPSHAITRPTPGVMLSTAVALYLSYKVFRLIDAQRRRSAIEPSPTSPVLVDNFQFVQVNGKKLRVVHIPHALGSKVPLLVFIHGVGGQLEQFEKQIEYFSLSTHILAIDLCGYGGSDVPESFDHYTTDAYVEDIVILLQRYKSEDTVLICHSYGCAVGTHLYSRLESDSENTIKAMVMIGPKAAMTQHEVEGRVKLSKTPDWAIDFVRKFDRLGGAHSQSVNRLLHASAEDDLRRKQLKWNRASKTTVLRRLLMGARIPTPDEFRKIQCPLLLMVGEDDRVCPSVNVEQIYKWCRSANERTKSPFIIPKAGHQTMLEKWEHVTPIISSFLIKDCEMTTMDPAWQITKKCQEENKWSLKNTEKVGFIVDISKDEPPYRTSDFEATSITYTKLPTVSKIPPSKEDVERFIAHCNACWAQKPGVEIAVHCHYGIKDTRLLKLYVTLKALDHHAVSGMFIILQA